MRNEKIGYKIREAKLKKIPYLIVIGEKEMNSNQICVRTKNTKNITLGIDELSNKILKEVEEKKEIDF